MPKPNRQYQAGPAPAPTRAADPTILTDEEADWVLARLMWTITPNVNAASFKAAFGVGCEFGVRDDRREAARAFVRTFARVAR